MSEASNYEAWKATVLNKHIGSGQCVALVVNNPQAYVEHVWPKVTWTNIIKSVPDAKDLGTAANSKYLQWIPNNHNNANQFPQQGDVIVFGATPAAGYTNTFENSAGHTGICDSASATGYYLLQQNAPNEGQAVNVTHYSWSYRPCLGWLRPVTVASSSASSSAQYYTVKGGDNLTSIAKAHGLTLAALEKLNPVTNFKSHSYDKIAVGEKVRIK